MARSREQAAELIADGRVQVSGRAVVKPATSVDPGTGIAVARAADGDDYASRGGHKLAGALDVFEPAGFRVPGRRCLDAGASTGGFTDVLLRRGAAEVFAVDVGYGQLAWSVRSDPRVRVLDRTNVRDLDPELVGSPIGVVVADLSFISLRLVLPALAAVSAEDADLALMVKPQFEVGRDHVGGGVVRDPALRTQAVLDVASSAHGLGLGLVDVTASPLPGPSGNVEYFVWLRRGAPEPQRQVVVRAVEEGPQ